MQLFIDTSQQFITKITIKNGETIVEKTLESEGRKEQLVLILIETILKENNFSLSRISEIIVSVGPGSFTGLRVGATVGSMLSLLLNIPINKQRPGTIPYLEYGQDHWQLAKE